MAVTAPTSIGVARVLSGRASYDDLDVREQAVVRAEWSERMTASRKGLDLQAEFLAEGSGWVDVEPDGAVRERSACEPAGVNHAAQATASPPTDVKTPGAGTKGLRAWAIQDVNL